MSNGDNNQNQNLEKQRKAEIKEKIDTGEPLTLDDQKYINLEKQKTLDLTLKEYEAQVKNNQLTQKQADLLTEIASLKKNIRDLDLEGQDIDVENLAKLQKKLESTQNLSNAINDAATQGGLLADKIAPISNSFSRAAVASFEAGEGIRGMGEAFKAYGLNAAKGLSISKMLFSGVERFIESTIAAVRAADAAGASFVQATGASRDFARAAFETRSSLGLMGISGAEAVETMGSLYSGFSEFSELSRGSQQDFTVLSAQIEKLGGDAAGMAQTFTKVAGMSLAETETAMREVAGAADALGIPLSQVSADLVGMGELFAKMGAGAMDVFLDLQAAAKATGLSVQSLYNIVGQYDTFEASSQAAGRLNMVLGGNLLDTYSLLNATEEERIELLQRAMEQSSLTFDEMDRFQKMEISAALGISLEEAAQLFGTTRGEVEKTAAELMHAGMTQEELAQRTRDAATAIDKFKVLMGNLAIAVGFIVEKINKVIDVFLSLSGAVGSPLAALGLLISGVAAAKLALGGFKLIGRGLDFLGSKIKSTVKKVVGSVAEASEEVENIAENSGDAVGGFFERMGPGIKSFGEAIRTAAPGLLAFGAALLMVGGGIALAAYGMSLLVSSFAELNTGGQVWGAVAAIVAFTIGIVKLGLAMISSAGPIAAAIVAIGTAGTAGAVGLLAIGAAAALIGVGILAAAYGFSLLVAEFKEMTPEKILATSVAFVALAGGIAILALSIAALGALGPVAFVGLGILAAAGLVLADIVGRIADDINRLNEEKISSFATSLSSLLQLASMSLTGTGIPRFIREVGEALNELPDNTEKTVAFKATADSLANLMQIGSSVEAEQLERIKMIIDAVSNAEGAENTNRLTEAINRLVRGQANNQGTTNTIELDGRVLARWIDRHDATRFRAAIGD
jgi:hypothetical protein